MANGAGIPRWDSRKQPVAGVGELPDPGAPSIDFIATLPTANVHLLRLLWSRPIGESDFRC